MYVESVNNPTVPFYANDVTISSTDLEKDVAVETERQPIKDVYAGHLLIRNAVSMAELDLLKHHHDFVTAENTLKPEYPYDADRSFDFQDQKWLVERIQEEKLLLHGHVLVWDQQLPEWLDTQIGELLLRGKAL